MHSGCRGDLAALVAVAAVAKGTPGPARPPPVPVGAVGRPGLPPPPPGFPRWKGAACRGQAAPEPCAHAGTHGGNHSFTLGHIGGGVEGVPHRWWRGTPQVVEGVPHRWWRGCPTGREY